MIRTLIRHIILEDLEGFKTRSSGIKYRSFDPKDMPRELKRVWSQEADHEFFKGLVKIHWVTGLPDRVFKVFEKMDGLLRASRKDEISAAGYLPGSPLTSTWGAFGVIVQGRTTLAAKDMNAISSGYYRNVDPEEIERYSKTSGLPRRAMEYDSSYSDSFILDAQSFGSVPHGNELIVDNWKPVGLVAPDWFFRTLKKDIPLLGKRSFELSYENLVRLFVTTDLPVYTFKGKQKDMTPYRTMLGAS